MQECTFASVLSCSHRRKFIRGHGCPCAVTGTPSLSCSLNVNKRSNVRVHVCYRIVLFRSIKECNMKLFASCFLHPPAFNKSSMYKARLLQCCPAATERSNVKMHVCFRFVMLLKYYLKKYSTIEEGTVVFVLSRSNR